MTTQLNPPEADLLAWAREPVSVVICAYTMRRWAALVDSVNSVRCQVGPADELVVVIDHNDDLLDRATTFFTDVRVVESTGPKGLSGARNAGVSSTSNKLVIFLDDDARAEPSLIADMAAALSEPGVFGAGGAPVPVWPAGRRPRWLPPEFDWVVGCAYTGLPTERAEVRNIIGAAMGFRREVFERVGMFSSAIGRVGTIPAGCEETELCIRLRKDTVNARILHLPETRVQHSVSEDRTTWSYFLRRCFGEGISKALVSRMVGTESALQSERRYVSRVLPAALFREIGQVMLGRVTHAGAAVAIVVGVVAAGLGYCRGRLSLAAQALHVTFDDSGLAGAEGGGFRPVLVADVDLLNGPTSLPARRADGQLYGGAEILVRSGAVPLAVVRLRPDQLGRAIDFAGYAEGRDRGPVRPELPGRSPLVSVVVPTLGRAAQATECVRSILATEWPELEIILVDNDPGNGPAAAQLRELAALDSRIRYIPEPRRGASRARNCGLAHVRGSIVAFTDDDVVVDRWWPATMVEAFRDPKIACVTGMVLPRRLETAAQLWFERYGGFGKGLAPRRFDQTPPHGDSRRLYPFAAGMFGSGNNVAFRRDVLTQLGGYDTCLGPGTSTHAGEDLDLFVRVIRSGRTLMYEPKALVRHDHRADPSDLLRQLHSYGRGISAMLCAQMVRDRRGLVAILRKVPSGIRFLFDPKSTKNSRRGRDYPIRLIVAETSGVVIGAFAYVISRVSGAIRNGR